MAGNKFLQGQLNQPITRPNYKGSKTDSLELFVNNSDMTITGNVIWDSFIGTTLGTAYSGADGARNYKAILNLTNELNDAIEQFITYKTKTDSRLSAVENIAENVDADITAKLSAEVSRSTASDNELLDRLVKESQRALAAEAEFVHKIETEALLRADVDAELKSEVELLSNSVFNRIHEISNKIDNITGKIKSAETSLIEQITTENLRAVAAEKELQNKLNETNRALASLRAEVSNSAASNKEDVNSSLLALAAQINSEVVRSKNQETEITHKIDAVDERVTDTALDLSSRIGEVRAEFVAADEEVIGRIESIDSKHDNDIRNLSTRISSTNNAITKLESTIKSETTRIDNLLVEAANNLTEKIDGNTSLIEEASAKGDAAITETKKDIAILNASLTSLVQEEAASRAAEISRLDAEVATIVANSADVNKHITTLETVVTHLENESNVSDAEFNKSIGVIDTKIDSTNTKLQQAIQAEVDRATLKELELEETLADTTEALEGVDKELDKRIIAVTAQLEELKEATNTSSTSAIVSLDALHNSIEDLTKESSKQFSLLTATDEEIEEQLNLLREGIDAVENDLASTNSKIVSIVSQVADVENTISTYNTTLTAVNEATIKNSEHIQTVAEDLFNEVLRAKDVEVELNDKLAATTTELSTTNDRVKSLETGHVKLSAELNNYKSTAAAVNKELTKINQAVDEVTIDFNAEVARTESVINSITEKDIAQDAKIDELTSDVELLQQDVLAHDKKIQSLRSDVGQVKSQVATTEGAIRTNATTITNVSAQVANLEVKIASNKKQTDVAIDSQRDMLNEHQLTLNTHEGKLTQHDNSITQLHLDGTQNSTAIENLYKQLSEETAARQLATDTASIQHTKEVKRSTAVDEAHSIRLSKLENNILETEDRLSNAITIKETESIARDDYLNEKINNNFDVLDEALQTAANELNANIFDERGDRAVADRALQTQLNTLSNVVTQNDTILSSLAKRVADEAKEIDEYIVDNDKRILNVEQSVDVLTNEARTHMKTIVTETPQVYTQTDSSTIMVPFTYGAEPCSIVQRSNTGNIQLPTDVTTIGAADAVPKSYVESLFSDMREVLHEEMKKFSFDIIDGGKAPIKK